MPAGSRQVQGVYVYGIFLPLVQVGVDALSRPISDPIPTKDQSSLPNCLLGGLDATGFHIPMMVFS